ncbi:MAG: signal peptidase II [Pirellulaceae bacterium]
MAPAGERTSPGIGAAMRNQQKSQAIRTGVRWFVFFEIVVAGTAVDLISKQIVFQKMGLPGQSLPYWLIKPYVGIETAVNPGALFGMGAGFGLVFAALSVVAAVGILIWLWKFRAIESRWLIAALGCVTGGILGNLYDRLGLWNPPASRPDWQSGVRDWILLEYQGHVWPNFNIADSLLVCGAIMLAIHSFFLNPPAPEKTQQTITSGCAPVGAWPVAS